MDIQTSHTFDTIEESAAFLAGIEFGKSAKADFNIQYDPQEPEAVNADIAQGDGQTWLEVLQWMKNLIHEMQGE